MLRINIETIPHASHRYLTVGDYYDAGGRVEFRISDMGNTDYEFLVAIHELIEWYLTWTRGISEEKITEFDMAFEGLRRKFPDIIGDQEPGDMANAPYFREHQFATTIEKLIAGELRIDWNDYDKTVEEL